MTLTQRILAAISAFGTDIKVRPALLINPSDFATQTAGFVSYDGNTWARSSGRVDSNPDNNPKYTALQYNGSGSVHYDRQYDGPVYFRWWSNSSGNNWQRLKYAINAYAGVVIVVEPGSYDFDNIAYTPGNFTIRGNVNDPSKVVFNIVGSETKLFTSWFYYDGVTAGQILENVTIEGITFNQKSTANTNTSYGPLSFDGGSTRNLTVRNCVYNQVSLTAITNFIFVKPSPNKLLSDILIERNYSRSTARFGRMAVEIINQDNHPNNDQTTGQNVQIRQNNFGNFNYCISVAGNFVNTLVADNLIGSNTSYGIELAGSNSNAGVIDNRFFGVQNVLFVSNYYGETGTSQSDYAVTGGQRFTGNRTLGHVTGGYVEIKGGNNIVFSSNDLDIEGGIQLKKTSFGGVASALFTNNRIVSTMVNTNWRNITTNLLYLDGASNVIASGNILTRASADNSALIQTNFASATGNMFLNNILSAGTAPIFNQYQAGIILIIGNLKPSGWPAE